MYRFISQPAVLVGLCLVISLPAVVSVQADTLPVTSGLAFWIDASAITGATNDSALKQWSSVNAPTTEYLSGEGNGIDSYVTAPAPRYYSSGTAFNNKAYVDFSGGGNMVSSFNTLYSGLQGDLTTTVFEVAAVPAGGNLYAWGSSDNAGHGISLAYGAGGLSMYSAQFSGGSHQGFGGAQSGVQITELTKSAGAVATTTSLLVNGSAQSLSTTYTSALNSLSVTHAFSNWFYLGSAVMNIASTKSSTQVAELIVFDRVLTPTESNEVGVCLQEKYGITGTYSIPKPGTLALLATGLIGLLAYAWRKRK